jgi:hypothetical protein
VKDRQVGRRLQAFALRAGQTRGQVGPVERRGDRHLLDDGGLGQPLVASALGRIHPVTFGEHGAQRSDRDEARDGVRHKEQRPGVRAAPADGPEPHDSLFGLDGSHVSLNGRKPPGEGGCSAASLIRTGLRRFEAWMTNASSATCTPDGCTR